MDIVFLKVIKYGVLLNTGMDVFKNYCWKLIFFYLCTGLRKVSHFLSDGVIGNTSDFGSEESRFEPWSDNKERKLPDDFVRELFILKGD